MNEESMAAINIIRNKNCVALGENLPMMCPVTADRPASWWPLLISKTKATVITAGWEKPMKALSILMTSKSIRRANAPRDT